MARQVVVLALVLFTVSQAYAIGANDKSNAASASAPAPSNSNSDADLAEPPTENVIGVLEAADSPTGVRAAPLGGPVPPGAFDMPNTPNPNDASTLQFSVIAGATILASFFYC